jgi:hypothetical protein
MHPLIEREYRDLLERSVRRTYLQVAVEFAELIEGDVTHLVGMVNGSPSRYTIESNNPDSPHITKEATAYIKDNLHDVLVVAVSRLLIEALNQAQEGVISISSLVDIYAKEDKRLISTRYERAKQKKGREREFYNSIRKKRAKRFEIAEKVVDTIVRIRKEPNRYKLKGKLTQTLVAKVMYADVVYTTNGSLKSTFHREVIKKSKLNWEALKKVNKIWADLSPKERENLFTLYNA